MQRWAGLLAALAVSNGWAQQTDFPTKPMRGVVPFAPGGGTDVVARPIAIKFGERMGHSVIYENRGGAGGVIAGEIVARAAPDGYTMLVAAVAVMTVNVSLMKMPFDPVKDFAPVTKLASVPNLLAARASLPAKSVPELVSYAKTNPGKLLWALSGVGSGGHLAMEMFKMSTGIDVVRVFYKGAGPATVALLGNEADVLFANPGVFMPHIRSGKLNVLAVASRQRLPLFPNSPTFIEVGHADFESGSWYGLAAPAGTPSAILNKVQREAAAVLRDPDIVKRLAADGAEPVGNTPEAFAKEIRDDIVRWAKVIKAAGIKVQN
jgi:tripartite-type tricarboxylate transporter receptor subunit TctC